MSAKHKLIIEITYTGSVTGACAAANAVLNAGTLQDAMRDHNRIAADSWRFNITNTQVK